MATWGYVTTPAGPDSYVVTELIDGSLRGDARLVVSEGLLAAFVEQAGDFGIAVVNVVEEFDVDHGSGGNHTRAVAFRRGADGAVSVHVEKDVPEQPEPDAADGPFRWTAERPDGA